MQWIVYALISVLFWGGWAFFGKLALRHADWAEVSFVYGVVTVLLFGIVLAMPGRQSFAWTHAWPLAATAGCGALGLITFYLALDRGKASSVVPLISVYPLITAALAVVFLDERLSALQLAGIGCAILGVALISLAG